MTFCIVFWWFRGSSFGGKIEPKSHLEIIAFRDSFLMCFWVPLGVLRVTKNDVKMIRKTCVFLETCLESPRSSELSSRLGAVAILAHARGFLSSWFWRLSGLQNEASNRFKNRCIFDGISKPVLGLFLRSSGTPRTRPKLIWKSMLKFIDFLICFFIVFRVYFDT